MRVNKDSAKNGKDKSAAAAKAAKAMNAQKAIQAAARFEKGSGSSSSKDRKSTEKNSMAKNFKLEPKLLIQIHDLMVKARVLEERLIRMYKQSDGYFWIGGPGEEAFQIPLSMMIKKGEGVDYDYMHLHYRSSPIMTGLGMEPIDAIRQMKNTVNDPFSGGRNFGNHFSRKAWNVVPVSSTIETQYLTAIGTGIAQKQHGGTGITIVNGGDAGTAEGDFASCLVWSSRPGFELPILMIVTNNDWGISTPRETQHGDKCIADRGKAFGIKTMTCNGNDVEESWAALKEAIDYIRKERKPVLIEAQVSRLYGHSSATGCNFVTEEVDCLKEFETQLEAGGILTRKEMDQIRERYTQEMLEISQQVKQEPLPDGSTIYDNTYIGQKGKYW